MIRSQSSEDRLSFEGGFSLTLGYPNMLDRKPDIYPSNKFRYSPRQSIVWSRTPIFQEHGWGHFRSFLLSMMQYLHQCFRVLSDFPALRGDTVVATTNLLK